MEDEADLIVVPFCSLFVGFSSIERNAELFILKCSGTDLRLTSNLSV